MFKPTLAKRVLFVRRLTPVLLVLFSVFSLVTLNLRTVGIASAASAGTINFQARLQSSAGAIVPDGTYNVEFKLYDASSSSGSSQGSCTGDSHCLWTETRTSTNKVTVTNGYLSVNLGSVTAFSTSINWTQSLWMTMNIGGTGSASWDGEMNPRLQLTAVPYAFAAGQLSTTSGSNTSALSIQAPTGSGNQNFVIQDQGAGGTYNILTAPTGSDGYIKLQGSSPSQQTGYFNISGTGIAGSLQAPSLDTISGGTSLAIGNTNATSINIGTTGSNIASISIGKTGVTTSVAGTLQGVTINATSGFQANGTAGITQGACSAGQLFSLSATSGLVTGGSCQTVLAGNYIQDATSVQSANINVQAKTSGSVAATLQAYTSGSGDILDLLNGSGTPVFTVGSTGNIVIKPSGTSLTGIQIENGSGTILDVDTTNGRIGINNTAPGYALDVNGDINSNTNIRVGGVAVCTLTSCTPASGSTNYIQNSTAAQANSNINIRSSASNAVTEVLQGTTSQTADILQIESWNGTSNALLAKVTAGGTLSVGASNQFTVDGTGNITTSGAELIQASSTTALAVQNSSNISLLNVDTSTGTITFGSGSNTVVFTASGGLVASGSAQHGKAIVLPAEYAGAVLDASNDSTCSSANNGILTSGNDLTNRMNYYNWTSSAGSAQCYDVVVQVQVPSDFASWNSINLQTYTSNTSNGTIALEQRDTGGSVISNYVNETPGSSSSWTNQSLSTSGTYTPGSYLTFRIRVSSLSNANVRIGNVTLNYNSKF